MKKAIYVIEIAHRRYGPGWDSKRVLAKDVLEALKKVKLEKGDIVEAIRPLERL